MRVTVCQTAPKLLDVDYNLNSILECIEAAKEDSSDLVVFPELALTGYFVGRHYHRAARSLDSKEIQAIVSASKGTAVVVGFIEESRSMNFYNSAIVAQGGELLSTYRKLNLPNYGIFEERKYFSPGKRVPVFNLNGFNVAVFICNDMWHPSIPYLGVCQQADIFITIFNSSQGSMGSEFSNIESWNVINIFYSRIFGVYNICANRVGEDVWKESRSMFSKETEAMGNDNEDELVEDYRFWGGSSVVNPFGQELVRAKYYEEDTITAELSRDILRKKRILLPYLRNDDPHFTHRELQRILY